MSSRDKSNSRDASNSGTQASAKMKATPGTPTTAKLLKTEEKVGHAEAGTSTTGVQQQERCKK